MLGKRPINVDTLEPPDKSFPSGKFDMLPISFTHNASGNLNLGLLKIPKLDFPHFNGGNVRGWVQKSNIFFQLNPT